jgi:hypothetical protein
MNIIRASFLIYAAASLTRKGVVHAHAWNKERKAEKTRTETEREVLKDRARGVHTASWVTERND